MRLAVLGWLVWRRGRLKGGREIGKGDEVFGEVIWFVVTYFTRWMFWGKGIWSDEQYEPCRKFLASRTCSCNYYINAWQTFVRELHHCDLGGYLIATVPDKQKRKWRLSTTTCIGWCVVTFWLTIGFVSDTFSNVCLWHVLEMKKPVIWSKHFESFLYMEPHDGVTVWAAWENRCHYFLVLNATIWKKLPNILCHISNHKKKIAWCKGKNSAKLFTYRPGYHNKY